MEAATAVLGSHCPDHTAEQWRRESEEERGCLLGTIKLQLHHYTTMKNDVNASLITGLSTLQDKIRGGDLYSYYMRDIKDVTLHTGQPDMHALSSVNAFKITVAKVFLGQYIFNE